MGVRSDPVVLTLHGLRLTGMCEAARLAERAGLPVAEVEARLALLAETGRVRHREGRVSGWMLTPEGRREGERLLAVESEAAGCRGRVEHAYDRFLAVNPDLLAVCSAWQVRDEAAGVLNDHTDATYDGAVIARLSEIDAVAQPICADLGDALERFGSYGPRLSIALERVRVGESEWFTRPLIDSYHTVWFELHEDLLATLGIVRSAESARGAA